MDYKPNGDNFIFARSVKRYHKMTINRSGNHFMKNKFHWYNLQTFVYIQMWIWRPRSWIHFGICSVHNWMLWKRASGGYHSLHNESLYHTCLERAYENKRWHTRVYSQASRPTQINIRPKCVKLSRPRIKWLLMYFQSIFVHGYSYRYENTSKSEHCERELCSLPLERLAYDLPFPWIVWEKQLSY